MFSAEYCSFRSFLPGNLFLKAMGMASPF